MLSVIETLQAPSPAGDISALMQFDAVREMAIKARDENEALEERLAALEKKAAPAPKKSAKKGA